MYAKYSPVMDGPRLYYTKKEGWRLRAVSITPRRKTGRLLLGW